MNTLNIYLDEIGLVATIDSPELKRAVAKAEYLLATAKWGGQDRFYSFMFENDKDKQATKRIEFYGGKPAKPRLADSSKSSLSENVDPSSPEAAFFPRTNGVGVAVAYFTLHETYSQIWLLGFQNNDSGDIRNKFYRHGCRVSVGKNPEGIWLVRFNGFNANGKKKTREQQHKRAKKCPRKPGEQTIGQLLAEGTILPGKPEFVRGNADRIRKQLGRKVGVGLVEIDQIGDIWKLTRKK